MLSPVQNHWFKIKNDLTSKDATKKLELLSYSQSEPPFFLIAPLSLKIDDRKNCSCQPVTAIQGLCLRLLFDTFQAGPLQPSDCSTGTAASETVAAKFLIGVKVIAWCTLLQFLFYLMSYY